MIDQRKTTPLYSWHLSQGARMSVFGGYDMPLWYRGGMKEEHLSVIQRAGLFDTSHMSVLSISGVASFDLLQRCFTKDLAACIGTNRGPLVPGRCVYGAFLNEKGHVIDDAIVYDMGGRRYLVVVNAGMGTTICDHLRHHDQTVSCCIDDLSDRIGKMDLQGPLAAKILAPLLRDSQSVFEKMPYFSFKGFFDSDESEASAVLLNDGRPILLSRTGYTGEFGFEIFVAREAALDLWKLILTSGETGGLVACGLAARDSLRTGAKLPLSHQDIGPWPFIHNPWTFALPFNTEGSGFTKDFIGAQAIAEDRNAERTYAFAGYDVRKVSTADPAIVLDRNDRAIGTVLTCATDMAIDRVENHIASIASPDRPSDFSPGGLSCGFIKTSAVLRPGNIVKLKDKRRVLTVEIVDDIRPDRTARRPIIEMA
ncbi:MAG: aminomethyl transferase family protein [Deltaproteobacteria bacterium]|nr:aminomethyl transferase family protein [Deltaproteobacteria bacterium]